MVGLKGLKSRLGKEKTRGSGRGVIGMRVNRGGAMGGAEDFEGP